MDRPEILAKITADLDSTHDVAAANTQSGAGALAFVQGAVALSSPGAIDRAVSIVKQQVGEARLHGPSPEAFRDLALAIQLLRSSEPD